MITSGLPFPLAPDDGAKDEETPSSRNHTSHSAKSDLRVAKVRAFTFNYLLEHSRAGFGLAIGDDGRYVDSVNLPGVELDDSTRTLLLSALTKPKEQPGTSRCGEHYEHAYVFYDEQDTPIAQFAVGDVCDTWTLTTHDIPEQARPIMQRVCEQSGVGLCMADEDLRERVWSAYHDRELVRRRLDAYPQRYRYRAPPIDLDLRLSELTERDKRLLCVWNDHHLSTIFSRHGRSHARIASWRRDVADLPPGQRHLFRKQTWDECVTEFPMCELTIAEVLRCQAHVQKGDPFLHDRKTPAHCAEQRQCLWGFETTVASEVPPSWSVSH